MSRLNVNSVNPHDGVKVSITGSTNGGLHVSASPASDGNPVVRVEGSVSASGELTASNAFFSGNVHAVGNIYVEGHATFSAFTPGGIQLGDTNTDNVTFGADVNSDIIPNINNTYDLGSDAQEWKDLYVEGTGYIDRLVQDDASVTNTARGDWNFNDDAGDISLRVNSADGNIGVKVSDPNTEFEVNGSISASGDIAIEGNVTGSNISASAKLSAEHLYISDDAEIVDLLTVGQISVTNVTASNISASGTITANFIQSDQLFSHVGDANTGIQLGSDTVQIEGNDVTLANFTTARIELNQPVTASVDISSSKIVTGQEFHASAGVQIADQRLVYHSAGDTIKVEDSGLWVEGGHLTASNAVSVSGVTTTGILNAFGNVSANSNFEVLGTTTLGNAAADSIQLIGNVTASNVISASNTTVTHSFGGEMHISNQVSLMDGGNQGRIGIGTLTPDSSYRLHLLIENSVDNNFIKIQSNAGHASYAILANGNHTIYSNKANGALELGAEGTTGLTISASNQLITPLKVSASAATGVHIFGGTLVTPSTEDLADSGAASITRFSSHFSTGGAETATLAAGQEGQFKSFAMKVDGGNMVITVTNAGWKSSGTGTLTFDTIGDACLLQYISGKWHIIGNNGVAAA